MIAIQDDVKSGDIVYVWVSPYKEKNVKKHDEYEFKVGIMEKDRIQLIAPDGGYSLIYTKHLLETWTGNIRKTN